jgi:hypothetical protein
MLRSLLTALFLISGSVALADTTIIMTRHGDRDPLGEDLNAKGIARAEALVLAVAEFDISAIYSPDKKRNLDTAAPLAAARNLAVTTVKTFQEEAVMRAVPSGQTVIWIGNTDNLERLFKDLGGEGTAPEFYGDLWILTLHDDGTTTTERRHYGD